MEENAANHKKEVDNSLEGYHGGCSNKDDSTAVIFPDFAAVNASDGKLREVVQVLQHPQNKLRKIALGMTKIRYDTAQLLANTIQSSPHCHLRSLDLSQTPVAEASFMALMTALTSERNVITDLQLWDCRIHDALASKFGEVLTHPKNRLRKLTLVHNGITDIGAQPIVDSLASPHCILRHLNLSWNSLSDELVIRLIQAAKSSLLMSLCANALRPVDEDDNPSHLTSRWVEHELEYLEKTLKSRTFALGIALLSVKSCARLGTQSLIRMLPVELIRNILIALGDNTLGLTNL